LDWWVVDVEVVALDEGDADGEGCLVGFSGSAFGFASVFGFAEVVVLVLEDEDEAVAVAPMTSSASAN